MAMAMGRRKTMGMAVKALILMMGMVLVPCAVIAKGEGEDPIHRALFDHIQEIRALTKNAQGEDVAEVEQGDGDWIGSSLGVVDQAVEVEPAGEETEGEGDATGDLFAHIYAVQRQVEQEAKEEEGGGVLEGVVLGGEEKEKDVEEDGVVDPLVQERFKVLETALKGLQDEADDRPKEFRVHGAEDGNLLEDFAQKVNLKLHRDPELEKGETHEHGHSDHLHGDHHGHGHHHHHDHDHDHGASGGFSRIGDVCHHKHDHSDHSHGHQHGESVKTKRFVLPEEIAEEEDLLQYGFEKPGYSNAHQPNRLRGPELGVWLRAMGCSLLVSLASLICLMLLPCIVSNGKPSETVVNALASFGAGAMLGDAFLHQLPHAFGKSESAHSHDTHEHHHDHGHSHSHGHDHSPGGGHGHAHSLQDLSIGLAVLGGILLFFIVEKIVRRYEELSSHGGQRALGHTHHHHQKKKNEVKKLEDSDKIAAVGEVVALENKESKSLETKSSGIKKRKSGKKKDIALADNAIFTAPIQPQQQVEASGGFVIGYLNLFSDAVHNFTDGMALGSAFLLHGTVGGWSRTLFLLAHELPQEVGDFGILVKSGFSVFEALAFNFLSALVALAGTAVALMLGGSLGHSSLIEGFIAGGFIYMSVGGVMPSMHDQGSSLTSTLSQLVPMVFGMGVAVVISLAE
ncbi:hypothetical protein M758_4G205100 [Ceratodon purpureus]|nr:hypothetical protein M758_4G205100 [Ceratodon purpureus]